MATTVEQTTRGTLTARGVTIESRFGVFALLEAPDGALRSSWNTEDVSRADVVLDETLQSDLVDRLRRYFDGETTMTFPEVQTPAGPTFFHACWDACRRIPAGATWSYRRLAAQAGNARAVRAAGQAMRSNRLPVIVPCHRVVASDGRLHGFAGSSDPEGRELRLKAELLRHEGFELLWS